MKKVHLSLSRRLAVRFSLILALIVICLSLCLIMLLRYNIRTRQDKELHDAAEKIAKSIRTAPQSLPLWHDLPYYITYTVYEAGTNRVLNTNDPFLPKLPLSDGRTKRFTQKNYFTDGDLNILYYSVQYGTTIPGSIVVQTALNMDQDTAEQLLNGLPVTLLFVFIPLLAISYAAAFLLTRRTIKPVVQMTEAARSIGSSNLDRRLPVSARGDELDTLASTFNDLFARLQSDFERERNFTSDVSHELKTPVAVILGHANLIRRWGKDDPVQLEKSVNALITEGRTMESVITNLLEISRLEGGRTPVQLQHIDLVPLFQRLKTDTAAWSPQTEITIPDSSEHAVLADSELLYQVFTIIISNSIKFSDPPAHITVYTEFQSEPGPLVTITIADKGYGISEAVLPHIFDRFYRGDPAHTRSAGGSGLGLSIVRVIMNVLHGSVAAESSPGKGTKIKLAVPAV